MPTSSKHGSTRFPEDRLRGHPAAVHGHVATGVRLLPAYFVLAFGISWTLVLLIAARTGLPALPRASTSDRMLVFLAMLAGPALASLGLTAVFDRARGLRGLAESLIRRRIGQRWLTAVAFTPAVLLTILGALSLASPSFRPSLSGSSLWMGLAMALIGGFGAGLFEELGWTGFATPRLLAHFEWWRTGIVLGVLWGLWHVLPDFWGGSHYGTLWPLHMFEWILALTAYRVLMTWAYRCTGSLLLAMMLHASFTGAQILLWPPGASMGAELLWYGLLVAALWLAVAWVLMHERAQERRASSAEQTRHRRARRSGVAVDRPDGLRPRRDQIPSPDRNHPRGFRRHAHPAIMQPVRSPIRQAAHDAATQRHSKEGSESMKILVGVDDSAHSKAALEYIKTTKWPAGTRFMVLSAASEAVAYSLVDAGGISWMQAADQDTIRQAEELTSRVERELRDAGLATEARVFRGDPRQGLVEEARSWGADLMVVGSHGRTGLGKLIMGSVASHVVSHSPCSVLVVKPSSGTSDGR